VKRLEARAKVLAAARSFFDARGYLEVETPVLVPSPGLDVHLEAFETDGPAQTRFLSTSPEYQMKRLLAGGHERIFQITRAFRKGELGVRHNPEFTMLEFYRAPGTMHDIIRDTEQLIARITGGAAFIAADERTIRCTPPFRTMRVSEAFERATKLPETAVLELAHNNEVKFYELLAFEVEPMLDAMNEAVTLTHFPAVFASLARRCSDNSLYAERFEIYAAGLELCNGFGELTCASEQRERFNADLAERSKRGLAQYPIDERFLEALERGLPECAGNAVGLDRLAALSIGETSIEAILAFTADEL
jgi:elongation factor P--(R)-beta-lysine ligase